jgi:nucleotide-binding universal stress UspA family protein
LVAYDGSEAARRALSFAVDLVGSSGDLGVINVAPVQAGLGQEAEQEDLLAEARRSVAERGKTASMLGRRGDPALEVIAAADEIAADFVIVGSRGRGLVSSAVLGSVSSTVAAAAGRAVIVVPPHGRLTGRCLIAAVDGSDASGAAADVAAELSARLDVPLLLAHAYVAHLIPGVSVVPYARSELAEADRETAERLVAGVADKHGISEERTRIVRGTSEVAAILALAEQEDAWMIAAGSRGRGTVKSAVLGSFSSALAAQTDCPVLVVPPGAEQAVAASPEGPLPAD